MVDLFDFQKYYAEEGPPQQQSEHPEAFPIIVDWQHSTVTSQPSVRRPRIPTHSSRNWFHSYVCV